MLHPSHELLSEAKENAVDTNDVWKEVIKLYEKSVATEDEVEHEEDINVKAGEDVCENIGSN